MWCRPLDGCVSDCVWVLLKGGCSSSRCRGLAGALWRSNWAASRTNPSFYRLSFSCCLPHLSSRILYDAEEVNSSSPFWLLCCASPPSGRRDSVREAWMLLTFSRMSLLCRSSNPCVPLFLACSPSPTRRCIRAGSPASEEEHLYIHDCYGGDLLQSGLYSHWTGWIKGDHLWLCLHHRVLCLRTDWAHAGL